MLEHPERWAEYLPVINRCVLRLTKDAVTAFGKDAWWRGGFDDLESDRGHAYLGYTNMAFGMLRLPDPDAEIGRLHDRVTAAWSNAVVRGRDCRVLPFVRGRRLYAPFFGAVACRPATFRSPSPAGTLHFTIRSGVLASNCDVASVSASNNGMTAPCTFVPLFLVALVFSWGLTWAAPTRAQTEEPFALSWHAPEGCPSGETVRAQVLRLAALGNRPTRHLDATGTIEGDSGTWHLVLTTRFEKASAVFRQARAQRSPTAPSC